MIGDSLSCAEFTQGTGGATFAGLITHLIAAQCLFKQSYEQCNPVCDGNTFDFIIVGAGTAGSLLASRLSEVECYRILVIEAGGDPPLESVVPHFNVDIQRSKHAWQYYTEIDNATNRGCIGGRSFWPRGRTIGGCGTINGLLHMRSSPADYEPWHLEDNDGWDWPSIKKYMMKSENVIDPFILNNAELRKNHGTEGDFIVNELKYPRVGITNLLTEGYKEIGLKYLEDINGPTQMGVGKIPVSIYNGKRISTATAFLYKAKFRNNLCILKNTFVTKIIFDKNLRAKGVIIRSANGNIETINATKLVIVSAGTVNTPVLLMSSGIGPKAHLQNLGIKVIADLPVGENLQDHVRIPLPITIYTGAQQEGELFFYKAAAQYLLDQTGPHSTNYDQPNVNAFLSVPKDKQLPDVQIDHNYFVSNNSNQYASCKKVYSYKHEICKEFAEINADKEMLVLLVALCKPFSRGKIMLRSNNPFDPPKIYSRYFSDPRDVETYINALKRVIEIIDTPSFKKVNAELKRIYYKDCDGFEFKSNEYWECMARTITFNVYHPVGTAKMGKKDDPTAVVDVKLNVIGVKGLKVVDASVMPTITSANTNAPTMMIAEHAADIIKNEHGGCSKPRQNRSVTISRHRKKYSPFKAAMESFCKSRRK